MALDFIGSVTPVRSQSSARRPSASQRSRDALYNKSASSVNTQKPGAFRIEQNAKRGHREERKVDKPVIQAQATWQVLSPLSSAHSPNCRESDILPKQQNQGSKQTLSRGPVPATPKTANQTSQTCTQNGVRPRQTPGTCRFAPDDVSTIYNPQNSPYLQTS